ncbi:hypothetical protein HPB48_020235 [Haemaphysalis longicornis]|uniref:Uncharacterized protein n=1 Tax=Haemaphysalis longicornis TaxID=44386 RepID=A0A9J6FFD9_HAELO|nr:hypothetical protein HPB48_020235 [Haemaphysalis longicornis]
MPNARGSGTNAEAMWLYVTGEKQMTNDQCPLVYRDPYCQLSLEVTLVAVAKVAPCIHFIRARYVP